VHECQASRAVKGEEIEAECHAGDGRVMNNMRLLKEITMSKFLIGVLTLVLE
jgi:predicted transcriptional regulator